MLIERIRSYFEDREPHFWLNVGLDLVDAGVYIG